MALILILLPLGLAVLVFTVPSNRLRPWLVPVGALAQLLLVLTAVQRDEVAALDGWLALDPLGKVLLLFVSGLFLMCAVAAAGYLAREPEHHNRTFCTCLMLSLAMMTLVILAHHLGLMWVAMEATTLVMAPNLYFHRDPRSLEATWKYLLICSVGIAIALLGSFFLAYATLHAGLVASLRLEDLVRQAPQLSRPWLHAAFVLLFVGYGTKMGLAPMHTWLPDAHGEAPAPVSALLSGVMLPCAFLAILRVYQICQAAGDFVSFRPMMIAVGLLSMAVAAGFMVRQRDLKRLLAYSSIEHMGILAIGAGIGGVALFAALLHVITNGFTKAALFLSAGTIQKAYGSKHTEDITGALRRLPLTGALFLAGFFAITGSPPFGPFVSEFGIVSAALADGHYRTAAVFLVLLFFIFLGMGATVLPVVLGRPPAKTEDSACQDDASSGLPALACMGLVLLLGLYLPPPLVVMLQDATTYLEGPR